MFAMRVDHETELQLLEERHADELFALVDRNRAHLREWLPWLDANTRAEDSRAFIQMTLQQFAGNNGFQAAIRREGRLAGIVGLHFVDWTNRVTSIGYWLGREHAGRGVMTRAVARVLDHAFGELRLGLVEIRCAPGNHKSRAIPERLGFTCEGQLRQREWLYDHFVDHVVYSLRAEEWAGPDERTVRRPR